MTSSANKPDWKKSRTCSSGACVEVARVGDHYLVRDSKNPEVPPLEFTAEEWREFSQGMAAGDFHSDEF
jgi:hypothetical protein